MSVDIVNKTKLIINSPPSSAAVPQHPFTQFFFQHANASRFNSQSKAWDEFQKLALDVQRKITEIADSELVVAVLKSQFGEGIVERVLKRYAGLADKKVFTVAEFRTLLTGIAAAAQQSDLEELFKILKQKADPIWTKFNSFDDIDDEHIGKLLNHFIKPAQDLINIRKAHESSATIKKIIDITILIFQILGSLALITVGILSLPFCPGAGAFAIAVGALALSILIGTEIYFQSLKKEPSYKENADQDEKFVTVTKYAESYSMDGDGNQKIAASEYLGHQVAYLNLKEGQIIPINEEQGKVTYAKVRKVINHEGFVCTLLTPLQEKQYLIEQGQKKQDQKEFPVWQLFRGTHDLKSLRRDLEPYSAGHSSYKLHETELLESKAKIVPDNVNVREINAGHSLGGADAQRSLESTVRKIAEVYKKNNPALSPTEAPERSLQGRVKLPQVDLNTLEPYFEKVRRIETYTWNSAGIANETNERLKANLRILTPKHNALKIGIYSCKVGGDIIQQSGQTTAGYGLGKDAPNVTREVYQFEHGFAGIWGFIRHFGLIATAQAHCIINLDREQNGGRDPRYHHHTANKNLGAVEEATGYHLVFGNTWEKVKWFIASKLLGSSIFDGKRYYSPWEI